MKDYVERPPETSSNFIKNSPRIKAFFFMNDPEIQKKGIFTDFNSKNTLYNGGFRFPDRLRPGSTPHHCLLRSGAFS